MGRPSVRDERQSQIMDAVQACIVEYGLAGTTLERIAEKAGLTRSLVRHHTGNRDEILELAVERSFERYIRFTGTLEDLPGEERLSAWLDMCVCPGGLAPEAMIIFDELIALGHHDAGVRDRIRDGYEFLLSFLDGALAEIYPDSDPEQRHTVACGIAHVGDQAERWGVIGVGEPKELRRRARDAAELLADSLASSD